MDTTSMVPLDFEPDLIQLKPKLIYHLNHNGILCSHKCRGVMI